MSHETPINDIERKLRTICYVRWHGMHHSDGEAVENSLLAFLYDIPHFGACGVFPPFHLFNQRMRSGGGKGGMSPGATWEPFEVTAEEYRDLVEAVHSVPPELIRDRARYAHLAFKFDPAFDGPPETYPVRREPKRWDKNIPPDLKEYTEWSGAVCAKHRESHHAELRRAGFMK